MKKEKSSIDERIEGMLKEESAQSEAVKSLINVKEREIGKLGSEIELKTDLSDKDICVHTAVDMMSNLLEKTFNKKSIIGDLINIKERKLLSKNRQSRREIVEVAKSPDMNMLQDPMQQSAVKRWFGSKKPQQPPQG